MSEGLTLAKLVAVKKLLDAEPSPYFTMFLGLRQLRHCGWTPLQIQQALRDGRVVKAVKFKDIEYIPA